MREAISGTTLFMIVIFFVLLFAGYLCLSINQNKAFAVKNAIVRITERHGIGVTNASGLAAKSNWKDEIEKELKYIGYNSRGECDDASWTGFDVHGNIPADPHDVFFCIKAIKKEDECSVCEEHKQTPNSNLHYFQIKTFYHFDIPVIREVFKLAVEGTTKPLRSSSPTDPIKSFFGG